MYKLKSDKMTDGAIVTNTVMRLSDNAFIPFDPANCDYQQFRVEVANGTELQDADGNPMTAKQVQEFLATLP